MIADLDRRARNLGFRLGLQRRSAGERPEDLGDGVSPISLDMAADSRVLLITVGGLLGEMSMPSFEFFKATAGLPCKRVFLRDLHQSWYHRGLPGHATSLVGVADSLRELASAQQVDRLVLAGSSAGGYAALVFGTLLGADSVLCFGPQSVLELEALAEIDDHRWDDQLRTLFCSGAMNRDWTDLRTALPRVRWADTRCEIYFDDSMSSDRSHAERLRGIEGVRLYRLASADIASPARCATPAPADGARTSRCSASQTQRRRRGGPPPPPRADLLHTRKRPRVAQPPRHA